VNWVGWVLFAACLVVSAAIGWTARGYYYELKEEETGG
jgi:hypothetical protein